MAVMRNIIDTWNMIEKYDIQGAKEADSRRVVIPDSEYERLLTSVKNKRYILNLRADRSCEL